MNTKSKITVAIVLSAITLFTSFSKASEFYKCMSLNIGAENTTWTMFVSKSISEEINSQMTVDQIVAAATTQKEIEKIIQDVAQKNLARFIGNSTTSVMTKKDYNFNTEFTHAIRLFNRHLRMRLNQMKNKNWTKPLSFQIVFAPKISETLLDRKSNGVVPRLSIYPKDRFLVMEQMPETDSIAQNFNETINNLSSAGINLLAHKALTCGSADPYLVSANISVSVFPDVSKSSIKSQLVIGMPMGVTMPFKQANDQISFTSVVMPEKVNDLKFNNGYAPLSEFPMAFVNSTGTLESSEMPILVRFGTIGSYSSSGWERTNGAALRSKVPRLRGTPTGKIKEMLNVDFSIFNISATMDYSKYQKNEVLEIKELNLYISAGLDAMTGFKVGMINKKDIDDQFRSEINKAIKAKIEQQTAELKNKAIKIISENAQLQPTEVETLLKSLFSAVKTKREAL